VRKSQAEEPAQQSTAEAQTPGVVGPRSATIRLPSPSAPRLSVVVTAWRAAPLLTTCLRSLAADPTDLPYEVIVVLNDPDKGLLEDLERLVEGAKVIELPVNLGHAGACNRAAAVAAGDYLVLLDDDTEVERGWLDALMAAADGTPEASAVGSALLDAEGRVAELGRIVWKDGTASPLSPALVQRAGAGVRLQTVQPVDCCSSAALLVRSGVFEEVGGFDEGYFPAYGEDVDLCLKIWARGDSVLCQPASRVRHRCRSSMSALYGDFVSSRSQQYLAERWSAELAEREPPAADDGQAVQRALERAGRPVVAPPASSKGPPRQAQDGRPLATEDQVAALRHELAVREAFAVAMEWETIRLSTDMSRVADERADLATRARALEMECTALRTERDTARRQRDTARRQRDEEAAVVLAFRNRASTRIADQLAARLRRLPGAAGLARWLLQKFRAARG